MGLLFALLGPLALALLLRLPLVQGRFDSDVLAVLGLLLQWALVLAVLALILGWERRSLSSIGWRRLTARDLLLALGLGVGLSLSVPLLTLLASQIVPSPNEGSILTTGAAASPLLMLGAVLTAGVVEEFLFRGYAIERLLSLTGSKWVAGSISLGAFVLPHLIGWNPAHVVGVVLPLGLALTFIYLWRRSLLFAIIVHTVVDLPLVVIALLTT